MTIRPIIFALKPLLRILGLLLLSSLTTSPVRTQEPLAAGRTSAIDASFGYAYSRVNVPDSGSIGMSGPHDSFTVDLIARIGMRADFSYLRSSEVFGSGRHNDALVSLGGPVVYLARTRRTDGYVQALFGGARMGGVNNWQYGGYLSGYVVKPAWSFGAGGQRAITKNLSIRVGVDYVHTGFFDQTGAMRGSYNFRGTVGMVYSFGRGHRH